MSSTSFGKNGLLGRMLLIDETIQKGLPRQMPLRSLSLANHPMPAGHIEELEVYDIFQSKYFRPNMLTEVYDIDHNCQGCSSMDTLFKH